MQAAHPTVSATDENLLAGMKIFKDACSGCHGDPNASSDYGASFYPHVPQFALNPPGKPDWQLFWIVRNGVRYSGMSAWDGQWQNDKAVSDDHIWKVVTFLSRLNSLPPSVNAEWHRKTQPRERAQTLQSKPPIRREQSTHFDPDVWPCLIQRLRELRSQRRHRKNSALPRKL